MSRKALLAGFTIVACLAGCPNTQRNTQPPGEEVKSDKARNTSPDVSADDLAELVAGNSAFAFDLYQQVRTGDGNLFFSPYSISSALAMTYAGARGQTEQEMADTLDFSLPQERLHPAFNALDLALASRAADGDFQLNIVNRLWGQTGFTFLPGFLDVLAENYGAGLSLLDFIKNAEAARVAINDWVAEQTNDRIQDLIPAGAVNDLTRLVLTNAIYFKADWAAQFEPSMTQDGAFHLLGGDEITVPMMHKTTDLGYAAGDGYQLVELPYKGDEVSMVVLLPDTGRFEEIEAQLDGPQMETWLAGVVSLEVKLTIPKFTMEQNVPLTDSLSAMGMSTPFSDAADFSGMTDQQPLRISSVLHKAFVVVNEEGTEAAAATAVIFGATSVPPPPPVVEIDRPFIFLIRDRVTGTVLFLGRVLNPGS
jgi:serpin B